MVQVEIHASDGREPLTRMLCLDVSFPVTPCVASNFILGFETQIDQAKPFSVGFDAQTTKLSWRSISATPPP